MLKISWLQKVTNQEVLNMIDEERNMISIIILSMIFGGTDIVPYC